MAIKRHKMRNADKPEKLIYIERNSVEAVLSHTNRGGNASDEDLRSGLFWWKELRDFYLEFDPVNRIIIRFEDILENNSGWIRDLAAFLELQVTDKQIEECQKSLPQAKSVLTRAAKTTSKSTYTDLFPERAAFLRSLQTSH